MNHSLKKIATLSSLAIFASCSSPVVVENFPSGTGPSEAVEMAKTSRNEARTAQADVLAYKEYKKGIDELDEAREDMSEQDEREDVLESAAEARSYFNKSTALANERRTHVEDILTARQATVDAGVAEYDDLKEKRRDIDDDLRSKTDGFQTALETKHFTDLQKRYLELEVEATQRKELADVRDQIENAIDKDADDRAPNTFKMAQKHLAAAENLIATNVRQPEAYAASVAEAERSAILLDDVMKKFDKLGSNVSEQAALELVYQDRKIERQDERIGDLRGDVQQYATGLSLMGAEVNKKDNALMSAQSKIEFQKALERVGSELPESDAEVYQQGNKLIIRLKKMNFATGSAEIPKQSEDLLANIGEIIGELNPESILVQGHTDSRGSDQLNQNLSEKRAKSVEDYLAKNVVNQEILDAKGFGESSPLASNDSAQGRSQNRRVDIVITAKPE